MQDKKTLWELIEDQKHIIITIAAVVAFFFWQVALPLQKINLQLAQIQLQLTDADKKFEEIQKVQKSLTDTLTIVQTKLEEHLKQK